MAVAAVKRKIEFVNADREDQVENPTKRPTIDLSPDKKEGVLAAMVQFFILVAKDYHGNYPEAFLDLTFGIGVANTLFSCYNALRQAAQGTGGGGGSISKSFSFRLQISLLQR